VKIGDMVSTPTGRVGIIKNVILELDGRELYRVLFSGCKQAETISPIVLVLDSTNPSSKPGESRRKL